MGDKWWECFPFEQEIEGEFLSFMQEKRQIDKLKRQQEALRKIIENEEELGLDW